MNKNTSVAKIVTDDSTVITGFNSIDGTLSGTACNYEFEIKAKVGAAEQVMINENSSASYAARHSPLTDTGTGVTTTTLGDYMCDEGDDTEYNSLTTAAEQLATILGTTATSNFDATEKGMLAYAFNAMSSGHQILILVSNPRQSFLEALRTMDITHKTIEPGRQLSIFDRIN